MSPSSRVATAAGDVLAADLEVCLPALDLEACRLAVVCLLEVVVASVPHE